MQNILQNLCSELESLKQAEQRAKENRMRIEQQIVDTIATKGEGTDITEAGPFKITVTSKLSRSLDASKYEEIKDTLPSGCQCVTYKPSLILKKYRHLEAISPETAALFVTSKPAKATVKAEHLKQMMEAA